MSSKFFKAIKNTSLSLTSLLFSGLILLGCVYFYIALSLPDVVQLKDAHLQVPLRVYTKDNRLIAEFGEKKRIPITVDQVPPQLIQAILDTEDQRFYEHRGVDFFGLIRAAKAVLGSGHKTQGASTITMQVARNFFLSPEKTYLRKINEMLLAFKIDSSFSKKEVLELYLNKIYLGQRSYGVAAAAYVYFGKPLDQLNLPELALIAGLPQAPSRDNPLANPGAALDRRNHVLARMLGNNHITAAQYNAAVDAPLGVSYHGLQAEVEAPYVAEMVRNAMVAQFGDSAYEEGYKVYTTVNSEQQNAANEALRDGLMAYEERHGYNGVEVHLKGIRAGGKNNGGWQEQLRQIPVYGALLPVAVLSANHAAITALLWDGAAITIPRDGFKWALRNGRNAEELFPSGSVVRARKMADGSWRLAQLPKISGALVALDTKSGAVQALIGGFSYTMSNFNRAVQAGRQTGSVFKPFLYSAALAKDYTLASIINDAPITIVVPITNEVWQPRNDNQRFYGPTRLKVALTKSRNVVSVRLLQAIGVPYAVNYFKEFGFDASEIPSVPSLALGVASISPLKVAAGYAVFANGGCKITPYFIDAVVDRDNKVIFKANPARVMNDENRASKENDVISNDELRAGNVAAGDSNKKIGAKAKAAASTGVTADANAATSSSPAAPRVITAQNAYLMTSALKGVIESGTARKAAQLKRSDLAGKTGSTNDLIDGWFAGFNNDLVAVVWVGYDQPKSIYEHGAESALPIWMEFIGKVLTGKPARSMVQPEGITTARIDPNTGLLARPGQKNAIFEMFTDNTVPAEESVGDEDVDATNDISDEEEDDGVGSAGTSNSNSGQLF